MGSLMEHPKYRLRTMFREYLPERLSALIPKGAKDCGDHEWYAAEEGTWLCYHCDVGVTHEVPWDDRELEARELEADAMLVRAGLSRRYSERSTTSRSPTVHEHAHN